MSGLLEEYGLDLSEVEAAGDFNVPDDTYEWVIGDVFMKKGTASKPDTSWIIVSYVLGDTGKTKDEWFTLPKDASALTDAEKKSLGWYKRRLIELGFEPEETNNVGRDDLIGLSGTFALVTTTGKNGSPFQNIRNFKVEGEGAEAPAPEPTPAPVVRKARAPRAAAKPAAAPAAPAPTVDESEAPAEDEAQDEPVAEEAVAEAPVARPVRRTAPAAAIPAKAREAGARVNPFG